ncbi:MAG: type II toxin-antitoxin system VapC family toxin [Candidatus Competibacteraceae bacterium]|nr:MAG: type II toxin-antitoxin system VapC family toxin [Candidatus Competibacteraceae bacterium]
MILVDTSVWIDHLRAGEPLLVELLDTHRVLIHPFIIGELACGNLTNRKAFLSLLRNLPNAQRATDAEVLFFIERRGLMGKGIGYIDAHLLAAVALTGTVLLWTRDKRLGTIAKSMGLAFESE